MRRVGLVGFGSIAEHGHLPALLSFEGVDVVAVADPSAERLARAAELLPEAALYRMSTELIAGADIDTLDICSPPRTHADLIVDACVRGIESIISEKPFVLTNEEYIQVSTARQASGSRVVSVNNWLHSDLYRHVATVLRSGEIGTVQRLALSTERTRAALGHTGWAPHWRTDLAEAGGGIVLDHGWHQLYLLLGWAAAPLQAIRADMRTNDRRNLPVEDEATLNLCFPNARGQIDLSWTAGQRGNSGEIIGTLGRIDIHDDRIVVRCGAGSRELPFSGRLTQLSYHPDWFRLMFRYNVLDPNRAEADRNFTEAGVLVSAITAAYRSARDGGTMQRLAAWASGTETDDVRNRDRSVTA